ncbi:protein phosphatase 2C domain-containing protein [Trichocoleus sp. Lan]|uniref:PP2C family protein-serine/threonine phosphatase n=1 Tax=Trichocoleus sp. Lan TaxID=2933927 RepID=UPI003297F331
MNSSQLKSDRYLWATGSVAATIPVGEFVQDRYQVVAPQVWLDTQPTQPPQIPEQFPENLYPYLRLYPQWFHLPEVYGYAAVGNSPSPTEILLLENVPMDATGKLFPSILDALPQASAVRQIYWLWQMLELWTPLAEFGVASSLLVADNLRVEGWRLRLLELYADPVSDPEMEVAHTNNGNGISDHKQVGGSRREEKKFLPLTLSLEPFAAHALAEPTGDQMVAGFGPSLRDLGLVIASWCRLIQASAVTPLLEICELMQAEDATESAIAERLNQLLLEQAAELPLRLRVAGATDTGPQHDHNEDTCYPTARDLLAADFTQTTDPLIPHLSIVCDGIGGHEGGEVASQLAVQSLKLQVRALLAEVAEQTEIVPPELVKEQLAASIRVVNNLICARNDDQGRESRRRMGTTLVMALQLPQKVATANSGVGNAHELYIAHVGDSRAYWITPHSCQLLTVDDDVAAREVRMGRSLYREALQRPDAGALTQALGTRDAEFLRPNVQRFIVEEDGLLLLCSDGLSDNNWVERSWADYVEPVLQAKIPLEAAVQSWIDLANQKNGHDNTSVVITYCRVSPEYPVLLNFGEIGNLTLMPKASLQAEAEDVKYAEAVPVEIVPAKPNRLRRGKGLVVALGVFLLLLGGSAAGLYAWWKYNPQGFQQIRDRLFNPAPLPVPVPETPSPASSVPPSPQNSPSPSTQVPLPPENSASPVPSVPPPENSASPVPSAPPPSP